MTARRIACGGRLVQTSRPCLRATDAGLLQGWGVFETVLLAGGEPVVLERHLDRLARGARTVGIPLDLTRLRRDLARYLARCGVVRGRLRITVTAGEVGPGIQPPAAVREPTVILDASGLPPRCRARGVSLAVVTVRRPSPRVLPSHVKAISYLPSLLARHEALSLGAAEALMLSERGHLAEADAANVFWVAGGVLHTPSLATGALEGVTRARVIEAARARGVRVREGLYRPQALREATEVFLTSSLRGAQPVASLLLDGETMTWKAGKMTGALARALEM